ncbi:MAG: two-component system, OmpR family, sensor histidine kinase VicK [Patescibacteria group bacterium]|nr:two-component system, OmpR family, sensor histidine kinase VicK [Patescibacteria group bacterium]
MSLGLVGHHKDSGVKNDEKSSDALLSLTAHELRTSLSVVKWYTEMLLDGDCGTLQDDQIKYLKTIQSSNQKAIDLIRSILNVSRLDLGTFSVTPEEIELSAVLKGVLSEMKDVIEEKGLSIEESYEHNTSEPISLDKQMCLVIFRNLISNALLFSKEKGTVRISVKEVKQGEECGTKVLHNDSLVVVIADDGIGIPEADKQHVFSKSFYRGSNVTDENSKGAGLGLYITKLILEKTEGDIWFTSTKDVGSTFYVAFPKSGMQTKEGKTKLD